MDNNQDGEDIRFYEVTGGLPLEEALELHPDLKQYLKPGSDQKINLKNRKALLLCCHVRK